MAQHDLVGLHVDGDGDAGEEQRPRLGEQAAHLGARGGGERPAAADAAGKEGEAERGEREFRDEGPGERGHAGAGGDEPEAQRGARGECAGLGPGGEPGLQVRVQPDFGQEKGGLQEREGEDGEQRGFAAGAERSGEEDQRERGEPGGEAQTRGTREDLRGAGGCEQQVASHDRIKPERDDGRDEGGECQRVTEGAEPVRAEVARDEEADHDPQHEARRALGEEPAEISERRPQAGPLQRVRQVLHRGAPWVCRPDWSSRVPAAARLTLPGVRGSDSGA